MEVLSDPSSFFKVQLELFDGPIDLLLHLVKINELPIEKVSLAKLTEQYLIAIQDIRDLDLELAGEYLVIAATLVSVKSSVLLNEPVELVEDEEGNLVNPHDQLLLRLKEAEIYKEGAQSLSQFNLLGEDIFSSPGMMKKISPPPVRFKDHDPFLLGKALRDLLKKAEASGQILTFTVDSISITDRMMRVVNKLKDNHNVLTFYNILDDLTDKGIIIGTFVALLELCKRQVICVYQEENEDIQIALAEDDIKFESLFAEMEDCEEQYDGTVNA